MTGYEGFLADALWFGSGGACCSLFFGWLIFRRLRRPLQRIIDLFISAEEGALPLRIPAQKGICGRLVSSLNIFTERLERQLEQLKQQGRDGEEILESLAEGVVAVDIRGVTKFANQAACKLLGASCDAVAGIPLALTAAENRELAEKCHEVIQQALQTSEEVEQVWNNRQTGQFLELISLPRVGQRGVILVIQDKTSDYKILEIGKDFIANASHELRTPITIIRGFAETLQDHPSLSQEMLGDIAGKIVRTSIRLDKLIKGLLTLADMEKVSSETFQSIDLIALVEQCRRFLLTANPKADIRVMYNVYRIPVAADPWLMDLAIMNLLENAIKYSALPAHIELSIYIIDAEVRVEVKDGGIGIPERDLPYIFDRFYTVDKARSRKSGGAGLGLSIVKTIVEKHRGKVFAESEAGKGSVFTICLPLHASK